MLARLFLILSIFILGFSACQKKPAQISFKGTTDSTPKNPALVPFIESPDFKKADSLLQIQDDSAFNYFNKVVSTSKDSLEIARAYNGMARVQSDAGDYFGSQESLLMSLRFLDATKANDLFTLSSDYNELADGSLKLKNYDEAIRYFDLAISFMEDKTYLPTVLNNKGVAYRDKGDYGAALALYAQLLAQTEKTGTDYARVLTNLAKTKWLQNPGYHAAPELLKALQIRKDANNLWALNSSYSHLADYYAGSKPDSALFYATNMYATAQQLNSPDDQIEALQKLIKLSPSQDVKKYFNIYQQLSDSVQTARNAAKNQFALVRYEAEKHKADNLRLQKENSERKYQFIVSVGMLIITSIAFLFLYQRRKKKIQETLLRISQRVHDVVANGLHTIMNDLKYREHVSKEKLIDKLFQLYNQSRDVSNEITSPESDDFHLTLAILFQHYDSDETSVTPIGNHKELWEGVGEHSKKELEYVMQELMVNMAKHSQAQEVSINFAREGSRIHIQYTDDGIGFPDGISYGNGIRNTETRIKSIGGTVTFDSAKDEGLDIRIIIPVLK